MTRKTEASITTVNNRETYPMDGKKEEREIKSFKEKYVRRMA
jgi:hypothetical protein